MSDFFKVVGLIFIAMVLLVFGVVGGCLNSYWTETKQVIRDETGPRKLLARYNWFKDAAAQLDARLASLKNYEQRFENLKKDNAGLPRNKWSREDREQSNLWEQEVAGIKASYNNLAAEYNAAMSKEQWRFCNAGMLPEGAERVLPREFRSYQ